MDHRYRDNYYGSLAKASLMVVKTMLGELLDKIAPFQGIIGIVLFFWGLLFLIVRPLSYIGWINLLPVFWITMFLLYAVQVLLGFLLGFGFISKMASSNEQARQPEALRMKLAVYHGRWVLLLLFLVFGSWYMACFSSVINS
ncbi:MAG: hypothetical protein IPP67_00270 [Rhodospirillaceae bacterium]|nr:hypothetical protein [Rhodospirillaceae bacterium]